jgi:hypothetical protein
MREDMKEMDMSDEVINDRGEDMLRQPKWNRKEEDYSRLLLCAIYNKHNENKEDSKTNAIKLEWESNDKTS